MNTSTFSTFKSIRRSPYQSLAAVVVLTITFFISYVFVLLMIGSEFVLRYFETQPQITAFFQTDAKPEAIAKAEELLRAQAFVKDVRVIDKEEALKIYQDDNKDDPLLLQLVTADILPASIEVAAYSIDSLPQVEQLLQSVEGIDEVSYQRDIVEKLAHWTKTLRLVGIGLISLLGGTSILIIIVITGMKISARRNAIRIMQLIGASRWYIRSPFIYEGIFYGVVGAFISWVGVFTLSLYLTPWLLEFLQGIPIIPIPLWFMACVLGVGVLSGAVIGIFASLFSSQRLLKS